MMPEIAERVRELSNGGTWRYTSAQIAKEFPEYFEEKFGAQSAGCQMTGWELIRLAQESIGEWEEV